MLFVLLFCNNGYGPGHSAVNNIIPDILISCIYEKFLIRMNIELSFKTCPYKFQQSHSFLIYTLPRPRYTLLLYIVSKRSYNPDILSQNIFIPFNMHLIHFFIPGSFQGRTDFLSGVWSVSFCQRQSGRRSWNTLSAIQNCP